MANATISFVSKEGRKKPYMVQWRVYLEDGGFKRVSKYFATRDEAEAYAARVDRERERAVPRSESVHIAATSNNKEALGLPTNPTALPAAGNVSAQTVGGNMSFYDYMRYYIKESGQCTCSDRTKKCYIDTAKRIHKELEKMGKGSIALNKLDDTALNNVIQSIANASGRSLLDKVYHFTRQVLKYAFARGYINKDIAPLIIKAKCRKKSKAESNRKPYTDNEIEMILDAAKPNTRLYAFISIALYTGMRPAEIRALRWSDIDWQKREIHVNGAVKRKYDDLDKSKHDEFVGSTKSESGIRKLHLADNLAQALRDWRAESECDPVGRSSEFIFYSADGSAMKENQYGSLWRRFINSNGWKGKGYFLYRFRHTFCTRLLLNDISRQTVKTLMGDSSLKVIDQDYNGITSKDVLERSREAVNNIFTFA